MSSEDGSPSLTVDFRARLDGLDAAMREIDRKLAVNSTKFDKAGAEAGEALHGGIAKGITKSIRTFDHLLKAFSFIQIALAGIAAGGGIVSAFRGDVEGTDAAVKRMEDNLPVVGGMVRSVRNEIQSWFGADDATAIKEHEKYMRMMAKEAREIDESIARATRNHSEVDALTQARMASPVDNGRGDFTRARQKFAAETSSINTERANRVLKEGELSPTVEATYRQRLANAQAVLDIELRRLNAGIEAEERETEMGHERWQAKLKLLDIEQQIAGAIGESDRERLTHEMRLAEIREQHREEIEFGANKSSSRDIMNRELAIEKTRFARDQQIAKRDSDLARSIDALGEERSGIEKSLRGVGPTSPEAFISTGQTAIGAYRMAQHDAGDLVAANTKRQVELTEKMNTILVQIRDLEKQRNPLR